MSLFANGKIYATMVFSHQNEKVSYAAPTPVPIATMVFCIQNETISYAAPMPVAIAHVKVWRTFEPKTPSEPK